MLVHDKPRTPSLRLNKKLLKLFPYCFVFETFPHTEVPYNELLINRQFSFGEAKIIYRWEIFEGL